MFQAPLVPAEAGDSRRRRRWWWARLGRRKPLEDATLSCRHSPCRSDLTGGGSIGEHLEQERDPPTGKLGLLLGNLTDL
jgi:hypothetical protein